jgi:predicted DNA-binding transcriptional regulator YafY
MRADRLISIVLLLQANGRMTAETLASRLEVSQRTILRDIDALGGAGVPVVAERGTGGGWRLIDGYETKLTGLTPAEIRSLFLARPPALLAELGIKDAADAAWLKLESGPGSQFTVTPRHPLSSLVGVREGATGSRHLRSSRLPALLRKQTGHPLRS